jgi:hypothetical protein
MIFDLPRTFGKRMNRAVPRRRKAVSTGDPVQDLLNEATEAGYTGDTSDLQAMADFCWRDSPTDGMAELMDELIGMGLISAPW